MRSLTSYLMYAVHGKKAPRRAPRRRTGRGPVRDRKYLSWIRTLPSAVSGQLGCEAAHTGSDGGMGMKSSDHSCIPLTHEEHREYHQIGKVAFEQKNGIVCANVVQSLTRCWFLYSSEVK